MMRLTRPMTVISRAPGSPDAYGNVTLVEGERTETLGELQQVMSTEIQQDRDTFVTDWSLWLGPEVMLTGGDLVEIDGQRYEVIGQPEAVWHPWLAGPDHVQARLRRSA